MILSSGCLERTARNTSNPSMSGMLKSRVIIRKLVFSTAVNASFPELLSTTEYPALSSILLNNLRSSGLSSTTKIDWSIVSAIMSTSTQLRIRRLWTKIGSLFFQASREVSNYANCAHTRSPLVLAVEIFTRKCIQEH